jgi:hypothetical protein
LLPLLYRLFAALGLANFCCCNAWGRWVVNERMGRIWVAKWVCDFWKLDKNGLLLKILENLVKFECFKNIKCDFCFKISEIWVNLNAF